MDKVTQGLLPCPFCGDPMQLYGDGDLISHVLQGDCLIGMQAWQASERNLVLWNTRAAIHEKQGEGEVVAWMRRCAFEKNEGVRGNRPKGWTFLPATLEKLFDDDVPLYAHLLPTPDAGEIARLREGLEQDHSIDGISDVMLRHIADSKDIGTCRSRLKQAFAQARIKRTVKRRAALEGAKP